MAAEATEATESLPKEAGLVGLDRPLDQLDLTKNWPTPLADDAKQVNPSGKRQKTLVSSTKGSGMKLNPNWVEQLMGLPAGWTQLPAHWLTE